MSDIVCSKCTGTEGCNRYCPIQAGKNLVDFINGIEVVHTKIGDLREDSRTKTIGFIVSGHIIEKDYPEPTNILSGLNTSINASGKFVSFKGMTPQVLLKTYMDTLEISQEVKAKTLEIFKLFNSNKLLPLPIKVGAECEVNYTNETGKKITASMQVGKIMWAVDHESNRLQCTLVCDTAKGTIDGTTKYVKVPLNEFGTSVTFPQIERTLKSSEINRDLIKMTHLGFIKPIEISDDKVLIAMDNQNIYRVVGENIFIIGTWVNGKIKEFQNGVSSIQSTKAYKKLHNSINYIEKHRRFIAPYGLFETNHIDL